MSDDGESLPSRPQSPLRIVPDQLATARPYRFTWDPSSRRPGPESVSGTTDGRGGGDYFSAQPRFALPPTSSSLTLPLGALPQDWSSAKHGFNAISTVLNNPHKRQAPPKAHSSLPQVVPADLPRVRRKDFDSYLRVISPEWDRFQHNTQLGREGVALINAGPTMFHEQDEDDHDVPPNISGLIDTSSIPPLNSVPSIFFEQNFDLGDPRVFNAVTEQHLSSETDPAALAHSLPLLEKFSSYADTVEQHLIHEISLRSASFFAALTNLHDLQSESEHCLTQIVSLRKSLTNLDENSAKRGLELVKLQTRSENLVRIIDGVKMVGGVIEMSKVARGLVGAGQWGEALGIIEEIERLWEERSTEEAKSTKGASTNLAGIQEELGVEQTPKREEMPLSRHQSSSNSPPILLSSLNAYASLPDHLRTLTMEIAASLSSELVAVLRTDLVDRISRGSKGSAQEADGKGRVLEQGLRDRLRPFVQGLVRTRGFKEGMLSWREIALGEVKAFTKAVLSASDLEDADADDQQGRTSGNVSKSRDSTPRSSLDSRSRSTLSTHLRSMRHPEFTLLLHDVYRGLLNLIEGLQEQGRIIEEILEAARVLEPSPKEASSAVSPITSIAIQDDLADILSSAAELSNTQAARIISIRVEEHAALELADFLLFFNESWDFVVRCEVICRRMIVGLRGVVVSQAKVFLQAFHQARISRSAKIVEDEQWNPTEITSSLQHIINVIIDSAVRDPPELVIKSDIETQFSNPLVSPSTSQTPATARTLEPLSPHPTNGFPTSASPNSKHLRIEERTYFAVLATTEVLALLLDYLRLVVNLTMLTTDSMSRVIEFLKAFNSRTCQVVLGAGAMRSAGLKNITAKHLALASQSLSIMSELIPYVRETFRRHLSPKQAVMLVEFDKLKRDYQEHQNEIHSKLIAIMGDRLTAHIKTLQDVDWNVPKPGGGVNDYMEILVKETVTLHKVLSRYLPTQVVEYVMTQVFAAINHGLTEEYGKIELPHQEAKMRLLDDAKYLHQKLSALKNVGAPSNMLVTVISEKGLPRPPEPPTPTRSNTLQNVGSSANQRLKGLLSGNSADKALPIPIQTSLSPSPYQSKHFPGPASPVSHKAKDTGFSGRTENGTSSRIPTPPPKMGSKQIDSLFSMSEPKPAYEPSIVGTTKMDTNGKTTHPKDQTNPDLAPADIELPAPIIISRPLDSNEMLVRDSVTSTLLK